MKQYGLGLKTNVDYDLKKENNMINETNNNNNKTQERIREKYKNIRNEQNIKQLLKESNIYKSLCLDINEKQKEDCCVVKKKEMSSNEIVDHLHIIDNYITSSSSSSCDYSQLSYFEDDKISPPNNSKCCFSFL
jgi:hypothetical protein